MSRRSGWVLWGVLGLLLACRPQSEEPLGLTVSVRDARPDRLGMPVPEVGLRLSRRAVEGGVLVGAYTDAAEGTTDATGQCALSFDRVNALDYRLDLEREGWFPERLAFSPEDFVPGEPQVVAVELMPRAQVTVHLVRLGEAAPGDQVQFRTLHVPDRWPTCAGVWHTVSGATADTAWTCEMPGDSYLPYTYVASRSGESSTVLDSIWLPAFNHTELLVTW